MKRERRVAATDEERNRRFSTMAKSRKDRRTKLQPIDSNATTWPEEKSGRKQNKGIADWSDKTCHATSRNGALFEIARATPGPYS
ncbi:hypothetical protein AVEN_147044-1 [Araneus ventricosus]|uniref:Uncharacterized protein n=1 Tax=Araneus ventricosus TaxID=182803 RepID=A0A4Y2SWC1_ARAVE|nr:hypothetical protein AVEN_147044-1 [Araneus ventricosus]